MLEDSWTKRHRVFCRAGGASWQKKAAKVPPKLTEAEQDLIRHMEHGYQLETDSVGSDQCCAG